jgi:hypothetical protein
MAAWWDTPEVEQFRDHAKRFLELLDGRDGVPVEELLHRAHELLPQLYSAGLALPEKPAWAFRDDREDLGPLEPDPRAIEEHVSRKQMLARDLSERIGARQNAYWEIFDPYADPPEDPVLGLLSDDLSDIYLDLANGAELWAAGARDEAVWEWRVGFESHWGEHATGALRAIRTLASVHALGFPQRSRPDV